MTPHQKARLAQRVGSKQMDFITQCFRHGLCTIEEARKAMKEVHMEVMNKIEDAFFDKKQFMLDRKMEAMSYE